jgi:hypothetical protein
MAGSTTPKGSYTVMNNVDIVEMPLELTEWLLDPAACDKSLTKVKKAPQKPVQRDYIYYNLTDEKIKDLLRLLPSNYLNNYSDWLKVLTVLKHHDKKKLWDRWSRKSMYYNKERNDKCWDYNSGLFDINYLVIELKSLSIDVSYFGKYKPLKYLTSDLSNRVKERAAAVG